MVIISRAAVRALSGIKNAVVDMTKEAVEFTETQNLFEVSMGKNMEGLNQYYERAVQFQDKLTEKLSANMEESMRYQALFNAMTKSMGVASDKAYILSENLVKMGYDLSSLYNIDPKAAMTKLRAGLTGQTKPLREIGIDITQTTLQSVADSLDLGVEVANLSQAEKVLLRYLAVLKQSSVAHGDFARTLSSPANQIRIFNAQITILKRNVGSLGSAILYNIMPYVNAVIMVINKLVQALARLFGVDITSFTSGFANVSAYTEDIADDVGGISDGVGGIAGGLGKAAKKAKEFVRQLMGFDEINNIDLPDDTTSGSTGGGGAGGGGGGLGAGINKKLLDAIGEYDNLMDKVRSKANDIRDRMLEWLGITEDLRGNLHWSWSDMDDGAKKLAIGLGSIVGLKLGTKLIGLIGSLSNLKGILMGTTAATTPFQKGLVAIKNLVSKVTGKVGELFGAFKGALGGSSGAVALSIGTIVGGLATFVSGAKDAKKSADDLDGSVKGLDKGMDELGSAFGKTITGGIAVGATLGSVIPGAGTLAGGAVGAVAGAVGGLISEVISLNRTPVNKQFDVLAEASEETKDALKKFVKDYDMLNKEIMNISWSNAIITPDEVEIIKSRTQSLVSETTTKLETGKVEALSKLKDFYKGFLPEDELAGIISSTEQMYAQQQDVVTTASEVIYGILEQASVEKRALTENEKNQILDAYSQMEEGTVSAFSESQTEATVILTKLKQNAKALTTEAASEVVKNAIKQRDESIQAAEDSYTEQIRYATKLKEAGAITEETYNQMIDAAGLAKDEQINAANETYKTVLDTLKAQNSDVAKNIDETTGEIKSKWDFFVDRLKKWRDDLVANFKIIKEAGGRIWDNFKNSMMDKFWSTAEKVGNKINQIRDKINELRDKFRLTEFSFGRIKLPHFSWGATPAPDWIAKTLAALNLPTSLPKLNVSWYAGGGMVDNGELFVAREAGAEMVGRIGNHTAVANNDQIIQGIKQGVYEAMMSAMSQNRNSTTIKLDLDRAILFKDMQTQANDYYRQSGESPFPA